MSVDFTKSFAAKLFDGGGNFIDVHHPTYGAVGDFSSDDTTAIQAALTAAGSSGLPVRLQPAATYKISSTLQWPQGVRIFGGTGASGNINDNSRIQAASGALAAGALLNTAGSVNVGQNLIGNVLRGVTLYGASSGTVNASRPLHAITFSKNLDGTTCKFDWPSLIEGCAFERFGGDAIQSNGGQTNFRIRGCRWDHISGYAVYVNCKNGTWNGSIEDGTWDTGGETETTPNGFLMLDGQSVTDTTGHSRMALNNLRLEVNKTLTSNLAVIALGVDPVNFTDGVQHNLSCNNVSFDFGSSGIAAANYVVGLVGGPSDAVDIDMVNVSTQFPDSVLGYCHGLTSTWHAPNPSSTNKYHPTRWTCRPFMYGSPGNGNSRSIFGEKAEFRASIIIGGDGGADANTRDKRGIVCLAPVSATPDTPPTNYLFIYNAAGVLKQKDSSGTVKTVTVA